MDKMLVNEWRVEMKDVTPQSQRVPGGAAVLVWASEEPSSFPEGESRDRTQDGASHVTLGNSNSTLKRRL